MSSVWDFQLSFSPTLSSSGGLSPPFSARTSGCGIYGNFGHLAYDGGEYDYNTGWKPTQTATAHLALGFLRRQLPGGDADTASARGAGGSPCDPAGGRPSAAFNPTAHRKVRYRGEAAASGGPAIFAWGSHTLAGSDDGDRPAVHTAGMLS